MLDRNGIGFPDLSYHSDEAWKADLATYNRHLGIMYSDCDKDSITLQEGETVDYKWVSADEIINMSKDEMISRRAQAYLRSQKE